MKAKLIGSIPNLEQEDIELTKTILTNKKETKEALTLLEKEFLKEFKYSNIFFTNTGRTSLYLILKTLGIGEGDEVLTQSFSCMAASQPILWVGAKPIFVDIEKEGFNIDEEDIKKKITEETKAIIVQHLFGVPKNLRYFVNKINKDRNVNEKIILIEDCAHSLGNDVGHQGDFAFFSFSQDKVISCVQGGGVTVNNEKYLKKFEEVYKDLKEPSKKHTRKLLKYRLRWNLIKRTYAFPSINSLFTVGKGLVIFFRYLGLIDQQVNKNNPYEKSLLKLSNEQAELLRMQIKKIGRYKKHREEIVEIYNKNLPEDISFNKKTSLVRYPILLENSIEVKNELKKKGYIVGNWYNYPVYPQGVNLKTFGYEWDCPVAEMKTSCILNLPTNIEISKENASEICDIVNKHGKAI